MIRSISALFLLLSLTISAHAQLAKTIQFKEEAFDFGNVVEDGGPAQHEFVFTNNGARPMKILNVQASCGCTTPAWSKDPILPGKTGYIQASFDPKGRPGYFSKSLTVTTDADAATFMLQIKGQVVPRGAKPAATEFVKSFGNWKLKTSALNMGKVYMKDEFVVQNFPVANGGAKAITFLNKVTGPKYIRVDVQPKVLQPGDQGNIKISYNGKMRNQYGYLSDNVEILTDDEDQPTKAITIYASLEDSFDDLSPEDKTKGPRLAVANSFDFDRVNQNTPVTKEIAVTNTGRRDLSIKSIQGNCTCISAAATKSVLKPGDSTTIKVTFNPQDREGMQNKAIAIYSNDPQNPVQRVTFKAYVLN